MKKKEGSLRIVSVTKFYDKKLIVDNVTIELHPAEVVGLFGPNGAGKTSCFYIMSGLIKPNKGKVYLGDIDITNLPMYKRARLGISYLPQEPSIFRNLTVEENIMAILEIIEPILDKRQEKLDYLLQEFDIHHLRFHKAYNLSGGERKRVEIARIIALEPQFVILDEPLAGIDPIAIANIKQVISHLKQRNIGIFITDHNIRDILGIVDRAYIIYKGQILANGDPALVINNQNVKKVYLGEEFSI